MALHLSTQSGNVYVASNDKIRAHDPARQHVLLPVDDGIICENLTHERASVWTFYCSDCGHWQSNLSPDLESDLITSAEEVTDRADDLDFLEPIRRTNYAAILAALQETASTHKSILDVGCATGQFLKAASEAGYETLGIEPNPRLFRSATEANLPVIRGYFPDALEIDRKFGAIIFNDVLEHIPDAKSIMQACKAHLAPGGTIIVNGPFSDGFFFKIGQLGLKIGLSKPWNRLWQKGFFTPHVHYFSDQSLAKLAHAAALSVVRPPQALTTLSYEGMWKRIALDPGLGSLGKAMTYAGVLALTPLLQRLPADTKFAFLAPPPDHGES